MLNACVEVLKIFLHDNLVAWQCLSVYCHTNEKRKQKIAM